MLASALRTAARRLARPIPVVVEANSERHASTICSTLASLRLSPKISPRRAVLRVDTLFDLFRGNIFSLPSHPLRMLGSDITDLCVAPVSMYSASHSLLGLEASDWASRLRLCVKRLRFKDGVPRKRTWAFVEQIVPFNHNMSVTKLKKKKLNYLISLFIHTIIYLYYLRHLPTRALSGGLAAWECRCEAGATPGCFWSLIWGGLRIVELGFTMANFCFFFVEALGR